MRQALIKIGHEYALSRYYVPTRVRVIEKNVRSAVYSERLDGVRVEVVAGDEPGRSMTIKSRDIEPWTEIHDRRLAKARAEDEKAQQIERIAARMEISAVLQGPMVRIPLLDFLDLAGRLGVDAETSEVTNPS